MRVVDLKTVYKLEGVAASVTYGGKLYDFGTFNIRISKRHKCPDDAIKVKRVSPPNFATYNGRIHPHICNDGNLCYGEEYDEEEDVWTYNYDYIERLLQLKEYASIGDFLINFLNSYNEDNAYWELYNEYCANCGECSEYCECKHKTTPPANSKAN